MLGIEPAAQHRECRARTGIPPSANSSAATWPSSLAPKASAPTCSRRNNVLAHVADLNGFVAGHRAMLLKPDGRRRDRGPRMPSDMIDHVEFDTIYHEHLCYFSLTALDRLFRRHGLAIRRRRAAADSWRLAAFHLGARRRAARRRRRVTALMDEERGWGIGSAAVLSGLRPRVEDAEATCSGTARRPERRGQTHRRLRCLGQGQHAAQLFRHRPRDAGLRRRSQHVQAGPVHAGHASAHRRPRAAAGGDARLRAAADLELRGRNPGAAGRVPPARRASSSSRSPNFGSPDQASIP